MQINQNGEIFFLFALRLEDGFSTYGYRMGVESEHGFARGITSRQQGLPVIRRCVKLHKRG